jgi:hypothetical protein
MGSTELTNDIDLDSYALSMELLKFSGHMLDVDMPLEHYFADGIYVRSLTIPKGAIIVGKKHRNACVNIMLRGDITIYADGDIERFTDNYIGIAPAGTQKAAKAHKETVWLTIHKIDSEDIDEIEKDIGVDSSKVHLLEEIRSYRGSL